MIPYLKAAGLSVLLSLAGERPGEFCSSLYEGPAGRGELELASGERIECSEVRLHCTAGRFSGDEDDRDLFVIDHLRAYCGDVSRSDSGPFGFEVRGKELWTQGTDPALDPELGRVGAIGKDFAEIRFGLSGLP